MEPKTAIEIKEKVLKIFNTHQSERERLLGEILEICNGYIPEEKTETETESGSETGNENENE